MAGAIPVNPHTRARFVLRVYAAFDDSVCVWRRRRLILMPIHFSAVISRAGWVAYMGLIGRFARFRGTHAICV